MSTFNFLRARCPEQSVPEGGRAGLLLQIAVPVVAEVLEELSNCGVFVFLIKAIPNMIKWIPNLILFF